MIRLTFAALLVVFTASCGSKHVVRLAPIPDALTTCQNAPQKPKGDYTQRDVAGYVTDLHYAWQDCHGKVRALNDYNEKIRAGQ